MEMSGQLRAAADLSLEKLPCYQLNRRLAGPQGRFGRFVELKNLFLFRDSS